MRKPAILSILSLLLLTSVRAQQLPLFSQIYFMRQLYNPALTAYNGSTDLWAFYREQWTNLPGHPITAGAVGDASLWHDRIGTGFHLYSDNTSIIHNTSAQLYYAQKVKLAQDHLLSVGVSFGIMATYVDFNNAIATDQNDPNLLPTGKGGTSFDMSIGIAYQWKKLTVHFAVPQVINNHVNVSTQTQDALYSMKRNFDGGASYEFSFKDEKWNLEPSVLIRSDFIKPLQWQIDADVMANYRHMFYLGVGYRAFYGVSIMGAVRIAKIVTLGYDYDVPIMKDVAYTSTQGTHEVVLGINFDKWLKKKKSDNFVKQSDYDSLVATTQQMQKNIDTLKHDMDTAKQDIDSLKNTVDSLKNNINNIKQVSDSFSSHSVTPGGSGDQQQQQQMQQQMQQQQQEMQEMKARIDSFEALVADYKKTIAKRPVKDFPQSGNLSGNATTKGDVFRLGNVNFETNSSYLTRSSYAELDRVAIFLMNNPDHTVRINGHTDYLASDEYNQWLSDRRAKRVYDYLADKGVSPDRMQWIGFGKRSPIADNNTEEGRAKNRRVEVEIRK